MFKPILLLLGLLVLPLPAAADWLASQRWQQRLVIVQGPAAASMDEVLATHAAALEERRMAVWRLQGQQLDWLGGARPNRGGHPEGRELATLLAALRRAPSPDGLHLFGLDGGLKATRQQPSQLDELIEAVDSMPMRVRELRR